jgi:hypothetical protein
MGGPPLEFGTDCAESRPGYPHYDSEGRRKQNIERRIDLNDYDVAT